MRKRPWASQSAEKRHHLPSMPPSQHPVYSLIHLFLLTAKETLHKLGSSSLGLRGNHPQTQVFRHQLKKGDYLQGCAPTGPQVLKSVHKVHSL